MFESYFGFSHLAAADNLTNIIKAPTTNLQAQETFYSFLNEVAGINTKNYNVTILRMSDSEVLG